MVPEKYLFWKDDLMKRYFFIFLLLACIFFSLTACSGTKIDLTQTYTINYIGNDGEGKATISLNSGALESQLDIKAQNKDILRERMLELMAFASTVSYSISPNKDLKNGQEITLTCTWDQDLAKKLKLAPTFKETSLHIPKDAFRVIHKISPEEAFENMTIKIEGIYPDLKTIAEYSKTNEITKHIHLQIETIDYEAKKVVVKAEMDSYTADNLGVSLEPMTQEVPLPNYSKFITDLSDLDKASRDKILDQANSVVIAYLEKVKAGNSFHSSIFPYSYKEADIAQRRFENVALSKVYFLSLKDGMRPNTYNWGTPIQNQMVIFYSATVYHHEGPQGMPVFFPLLLNNIVKLSNGDLDFQVADIELDTSNIKNSDIDYKSIFMNANIDKYSGMEVSPSEFSK